MTGGVTIDDEITVSRNFILKIIGNYRTTENLDGVLLFDEEIQFDLGSIYHNKTIIFCSIPDKFTIKDCYIDGNKLASANITSEGQANGRKLIKIEKSLDTGTMKFRALSHTRGRLTFADLFIIMLIRGTMKYILPYDFYFLLC